MMDFQQTRIWRSTLGAETPGDEMDGRNRLRQAFMTFRERAGYLAGEISRDLPSLTVHDLTHVDALWEMADLLCGDTDRLTPCEAFVLGGAFIVHDLGMSLAAYREGMGTLSSHPLYRDALVLQLEGSLGRPPSKAEIQEASEANRQSAIGQVLRSLHAQLAQTLVTSVWRNPRDGSDLYLLDDTDLRLEFGRIIGQIAASHWWPVSRLSVEFTEALGSPIHFPRQWTVDPLKVACLLRLADASHLDGRRAPSFLFAIRNPSGESRKHWGFQNRLHQPIAEGDRLVYTSGQAFPIGDFESWWLCLETLRMIDNELRQVDSLLSDSGRARFAVRAVAGIEEPSRLAKFIPTEGWTPVDTRIRVGDVAGLVSKLGGAELYGTNLTVPLRELIQNACDAIRARRTLEDKGDAWGEIKVRTWGAESSDWIEVSDTGIGMSARVLTGPFIDFGSSFWRSEMVQQELPGLVGRGFESIGKYGIGFFSTFMWGDQVKVITRRFDEGPRESRVLEFMKGLRQPPILRPASECEQRQEPGTTIRVRLTRRLKQHGGLLCNTRGERISLSQLCARICPTSMVSIFVCEESSRWRKPVSANDWVSMPSKNFMTRMLSKGSEVDRDDRDKYLQQWAQNLRVVKNDDGKVLARACIIPELRHRDRLLVLEGVVTVGGFRSSGLSRIAGVLLGYPFRAARDVGVPFLDGVLLEAWASEQGRLAMEATDDPDLLYDCAQIIRALGGTCMQLPIAEHQRGWLTSEDIQSLAGSSEEFLLLQDAAFSLDFNRDRSVLLQNVLVTSGGIPGILQPRGNAYDLDHAFVDWPCWRAGADDWPLAFHNRTLEGEVFLALARGWSVPIEQVRRASEFSTDQKPLVRTVSTVASSRTTEKIVHVMAIVRRNSIPGR
jgi:hypothetical protein